MTPDPESEFSAFLCAYGLGYRLEICPKPHDREDVIGIRAWNREFSTARLCKNRIIAATSVDPYSIHCIAHEVGHQQVMDRFGEEKFHDESLVGMEQISFMDRWCEYLMRQRYGCLMKY